MLTITSNALCPCPHSRPWEAGLLLTFRRESRLRKDKMGDNFVSGSRVNIFKGREGNYAVSKESFSKPDLSFLNFTTFWKSIQGNFTTKCDLALKTKTVTPFVTTFMSFGSTLLSKISQSLRDQHCVPPLTGGTYNSGTPRDGAWSGSQESRQWEETVVQPL